MSTDNNLWMGDVQPWMDESFILKAFSFYNFYPKGIKLIHNKLTNELKNFCFINFQTIEEANKCLILLTGKTIPNTRIKFKLNWANYFSTFNKSVYVGNLSPDVDDISLYNLFKERYPSVHHASVITDNGKSKGFGFILFRGEEDYERCLKEMNGILFHGNIIKVNEQKKNNNKNISNKNFSCDNDNEEEIVDNNNVQKNFVFYNNLLKDKIDDNIGNTGYNNNNIRNYQNGYLNQLQYNNMNMNNQNIIQNIININNINKIQNINYINDINKYKNNNNQLLNQNNSQLNKNYINPLLPNIPQIPYQNIRNNNQIINSNDINKNLNQNNNDIKNINNLNQINIEENINKNNNNSDIMNQINKIILNNKSTKRKSKYDLEILRKYDDKTFSKKVTKNLDIMYKYYIDKYPYEFNNLIFSNMFIYYCQNEKQLKFFTNIF